MSLVAQERPDRRQVRRAQTIDEIVQVAIDVMGEQGAAGLSLGEVARRIGIRPPSLYVYFPSKSAVYDAVFAQGWEDVLATISAQPEPDATTDAQDYLLNHANHFVRWTMEHPVHAQLMVWRTVPGYEPSAAAYEPALAIMALTSRRLEALQRLGLLASTAASEELVGAWVTLIGGVVTQQLANAPKQTFQEGTWSRLLPALTSMFTAHYAPAPRRGSTKGKP